MPTEAVAPHKLQQVTKQGFIRMKTYRRAIAMFVKAYAGEYYHKHYGMTGEEPINLIAHSVRTFVPNLVMDDPVTKLVTPYAAHQEYGELLGLAIDSVGKQIRLKDTLRAWITSAYFGWGIIKVGLAASGEMLKFGDIMVDPGQVYADLVDLDNYVLDPMCSNRRTAAFEGHVSIVPRQILLDTDIYNHDLVMKLPKANFTRDTKDLSKLTQHSMGNQEMQSLQDYVRVVELFVQEAGAIVTIPDPRQMTFNEYISVQDFNGPKEGPYVDLSFMPPVLGNPFPVAPVSLQYDMHKMANRTFSRMMDQVDRQKDVLVYNPAQADEAQDIVDARDGDAIASTDPTGVKTISYGGQNPHNELMINTLQTWFNYMSGNTDQMAGAKGPGQKQGKKSATASSIEQGNASVTLEDARGILYDKTAEVNRRIGWYLDTDPMINLPLTKRTTGGQNVQLMLTEEQKQGDANTFIYTIVKRSMTRLDPAIASKRIENFFTNIVPAQVMAAQSMMMMGQPYNLVKSLTLIAENMGIRDLVEGVFFDPEFQQRMHLHMLMGPQPAGKATPAGGGGSGTGSGNSPAGAVQNGGNPMARKVTTIAGELNQASQAGADGSQSAMQGAY